MASRLLQAKVDKLLIMLRKRFPDIVFKGALGNFSQRAELSVNINNKRKVYIIADVMMVPTEKTIEVEESPLLDYETNGDEDFEKELDALIKKYTRTFDQPINEAKLTGLNAKSVEEIFLGIVVKTLRRIDGKERTIRDGSS